MPLRNASTTVPSTSIFSSLVEMSPPRLGDRHDVLRLRALLPLGCLVFHLRTFGERAEAIAGDRGVVDEEILAAVLRGDEAVPLGVVEPLHGSCCHNYFTSYPT